MIAVWLEPLTAFTEMSVSSWALIKKKELEEKELAEKRAPSVTRSNGLLNK